MYGVQLEGNWTNKGKKPKNPKETQQTFERGKEPFLLGISMG